MHHRTLIACAMAAAPFASLAESNSPWLPIPGQFAFGINYTQQSGRDAWIGSTKLPLSAITGGAASKYERSTTALRVDYGLSDSLALDASIAYGKVEVGAADDDSGVGDSVIGLRWRALDEYENAALPTLTLRAAAIINGSYDGARLASVGKDANGVELSAIVGKELGAGFSLWGELGFQKRDKDVPNATFYEIGTRWRFARGWSANLGYLGKKFGGDLDIGGPGFTPARFQQVREERGVVKLGVGYAFAANQGVALNYAQATSGRNTVKDDNIVGLSYAVAF